MFLPCKYGPGIQGPGTLLAGNPGAMDEAGSGLAPGPPPPTTTVPPQAWAKPAEPKPGPPETLIPPTPRAAERPPFFCLTVGVNIILCKFPVRFLLKVVGLLLFGLQLAWEVYVLLVLACL